MPNSMTGFARHAVKADWGEVICEIRSVNHRYLEPALRLPEQLREIEPTLRDKLRTRLHRGKVDIRCEVSVQNLNNEQLSVNQQGIQQLIKAVDELSAKSHNIGTVDPIRLLQWPGIVQ